MGIIIALLAVISTSQAQPVEEWNVTFGGPDKDYFYDVQLTSDGGYIIAGHSTNSESYGWIIKTDSSGREEWRRNFSVVVQGVKEIDGGYIVAGFNAPVKSTAYLIRTDSSGNEEWIKTFENFRPHSIDQTSDGGYIITGSKTTVVEKVLLKMKSELLLIKVDSDGNMEWNRTFGEVVSTGSVQQTSDGGYIVATSTTSFSGHPDILLIKTDSKGNEEWSKIFGGEKYDLAHSVIQTSDGGYLIACEKDAQFRIQGYPYLIKTDSDGREEWSRRLTSRQGESNFVEETVDGYIVSGYKAPFPFGGGFVSADGKTMGPEGGGWIIKTDFEGNEVWNVTFPGHNWIEKVHRTSDGGYIVAGTTWNASGMNDVWLVKLSPYLPVLKAPPASTPAEVPSITASRNRSEAPATPGFEALVAVAGLLSALIAGRRL